MNSHYINCNQSKADLRSSYGNLYYSSEAISGAVVAEVMNDTSPEVKSEVEKRFSIGPVVERDFWTKERSVMDIDRGPCMCSTFLMLKFLKWFGTNSFKGNFHKNTR